MCCPLPSSFSGNPGVQTVDNFETALFGPFTQVLQRDVTEFKPYVFQIFAQLLEMRKGHGVSPNYWNLFQPCLQNTIWTKGNTPALARLLTSYLVVDATTIVAQNQLQAVLGCWQKAQSMLSTQSSGFELLTAIVVHVSTVRHVSSVLGLSLVVLFKVRLNDFH
jgi:exportin-2 (importin alpha re-exporter)